LDQDLAQGFEPRDQHLGAGQGALPLMAPGQGVGLDAFHPFQVAALLQLYLRVDPQQVGGGNLALESGEFAVPDALLQLGAGDTGQAGGA